jgi:hypothetical protein
MNAGIYFLQPDFRHVTCTISAASIRAVMSCRRSASNKYLPHRNGVNAEAETHAVQFRVGDVDLEACDAQSQLMHLCRGFCIFMASVAEGSKPQPLEAHNGQTRAIQQPRRRPTRATARRRVAPLVAGCRCMAGSAGRAAARDTAERTGGEAP